MRFATLALLAAASAGATTHCITIAGLGGEPDYEQRFGARAQELELTLRSAPDAQVETLVGPKATKTGIKAAFETIAKQAKAEDSLVVVLLGHGTFDGNRIQIQSPRA